MSVWIKICGNTSLEDAQLAADAGADAVGFVFAPSKRRVSPEQAKEIVRHLPGQVEKIGVFVEAGFEEIAATTDGSGLTGIQLQFDAPLELTAQLRSRFGAAVKIIGVLHFGDDVGHQPSIFADPSLDAILVDSRTPAAPGGTGIAYDWVTASHTVFRDLKGRKAIAAGGLKPENVAEAIRILQPWGVDVASGVEAEPGRKDAARVRAFIANGRRARQD